MSLSNRGRFVSQQNQYYRHNAVLATILLLLVVVASAWFARHTALIYLLGFLGITAIGLNLAYLRHRLLEPVDTLLQDTEQKLTIATIKMQSFFDSMPDAIIAINAEDNSITVFSRGAEKMFGYMANEVLGKNVNILMPEPYHSEHDAYVKQYVDTGVKKIIGRIRVIKALRKNGEVFDIDLSVSESLLPTGRVFNAIIRDITAKVRAETALAEKNRELEKWNAYERSFGEVMSLFGSSYDEKEILAGTLSRLAEIHPFPVSAIYLYDEWAGKLRCAAAHGAPRSLDQEIPLGEGLIGQAALEKKRLLLDKGIDKEIQLNIEAGIVSLTPAGIAICPIIYQHKITGVLVIAASESLTELDGVFFDRLSDQLGVALNGLKQYSNLKLLSEQLKIKSEEIAAKNSQLEHINKMKSEFLANMSHELRTPLNAIIGFSEVLKDGMLGELNSQQQSYITDVFTSGQHLLSLINDILDLSKIEAGKMSLDIENTHIPGIIDNSITIIKERAFANNIKLHVHIDPGVESAYLDARKLKQILYNLLSNAVKFTAHGGAVSLHARRTHDENKDRLKISVGDTGKGISQEDMRRLFKPFEQLDGSASRKYEGTGLGLVMVKRLVELHQGTVEVESTLGKGSTFTITLPYKEARETGIPAQRDISLPRSSTRDSSLILIVEDDDKSAELIRMHVEQEGYQTIRAETAQEGLELATTQTPDLITLDIMLPDMSGWEFLSKIKTEKHLEGIPVVIISIVPDEHKGFSLGASRVLQKPLEKKSLVSAINDELGLSPLNSKVLVVDDDPNAVALISRHLESLGIITCMAYSGREGIDVAVSENPDLILLDLMMPEMNGLEVVHTLKTNPRTAAIPIIILTAKIITAKDRNTLFGAVEIMEKKAFNKDLFVSDIQRLLRKKKSTKTPREIPAAPQTSIAPAGARSNDNPLILIVEDNQKESDLLSLYLNDAGYGVLQAENGEHALSLMSKRVPDLIILDLMMPIMDGFTFLDEKSRHPTYSNIPVIITSNIDSNNIKYASLKSTAFLKKPAKRHELIQLISAISLNVEDGRKSRVLIIDDDPKAVKIISTYLNKASYDIVNAYGGQEGLDQAKKIRPDLIILDLMMPELNGFYLLENLRNDGTTRNIPAIVLTSKMLTPEDKNKLMKNASAVYEKSSLNKLEFMDKIESSIDRKTL